MSFSIQRGEIHLYNAWLRSKGLHFLAEPWLKRARENKAHMAKPGTLGPMQPQPDFLLASFPALPTTHPSLWPYQTLLISLACDFVHVLTFFLPHLFLGLANLCLPWKPSSDVTSSLKWCLYNCWRWIKLSLPLCALILYRCVPLYGTLFMVEACFSVWPTKLLSFCTADNHPPTHSLELNRCLSNWMAQSSPGNQKQC